MAGFSREVARRIFAEELRASNLSFSDGEDQHQYAPQYLLTPTGAKCNRVFLVGALTERDDIGGDTEYWRGRVVDPTGSILIYAGQYQPEAAQVLSSIEPPAFVAVVGKPSLYETEDGNILLSIRAESIQKVDEGTRDRWTLDAAKRTIERLEAMKMAEPLPVPQFTTAADSMKAADLDIAKARAHYNTDTGHFRRMVVRALSSLRDDLTSEAETCREGTESNANEEPKVAGEDASFELMQGERHEASDSKPRADQARKPRQKAGVKETAQRAFSDDEIEEINVVGKKS
jgi:uncharacterized protein